MESSLASLNSILMYSRCKSRHELVSGSTLKR
jgi:hypothetical protein